MSTFDLEHDVRQIVTFPDSSSSGTEGVDAILAPIFKDVLDHDAGRQFKERLDVFIAEKVADKLVAVPEAGLRPIVVASAPYGDEPPDASDTMMASARRSVNTATSGRTP